MNKQKGYIHFSAGSFAVFLCLTGLILGFIFFVAIPWAWSYLKPIIHAITV